MSAAADAAATKACCAAAYSTQAVALVLGQTFHPGGRRLTRRLAELAHVQPGQRALDVASGPGTSALVMAAEYGLEVDGVDLSETCVEGATQAARAAGLEGRVRFAVGDAEGLPFQDGSFDVVFCECAFCTFPDKPTAAREIARVLKPGGRVALSDVTAVPSRLPPSLTDLVARTACVADARSVDDYAKILATAGLTGARSELHGDALLDMLDHIEARLTALRMLSGADTVLAGVDVPEVRARVADARAAVADGALGYALLVAVKPSGDALG